MPYLTPDSVDQAATAILPLDGPYDPERIITAARLAGELVRRLNHATIARRAFRYPSELDMTVAGLKSAAYGLGQLLRQLAGELERFQADPRLYADASANDTGVSVARHAVMAMMNAASNADALAEGLDRVTRRTHKLGLHVDDDQDEE